MIYKSPHKNREYEDKCICLCVCVCFQLYAVKLRDLACGNLITRILEGKEDECRHHIFPLALSLSLYVCVFVFAT